MKARRFSSFIKLTRIEHGVFAGIVPVATYLLTTNHVNIITLIILYMTTLLAEVYLFVLNDIMNIEEDKINRPWAPLVRGEIRLREAYVIVAISLFLGIVLVLLSYITNLLNTISLAVYITAIIVGTLYNIYLKRLPLVGNFATSLTTSLTFLYGMMKISIIPIVMFLISIFACLGRELIKSIIDIEGDKVAGLRTLPIVKGVEFCLKLAKAFEITALVIFGYLLMYSLIMHNIYMMLTIGIGFIVSSAIIIKTLFLRNQNDVNDFESARRGILNAMFIVILTYFMYSVVTLL